jgi:ADP-ribosylglycohydrolase
MMQGAIIGDIVGSTRERHNIKTEDFKLIPSGSRFTDDTVMTLAVAKWLMDDPTHHPDTLVTIMQDMGRKYPDAGFGGMFRNWLNADNPQPYGSYGNGSAMRVSPVGLYANTLDEALELARITASVTHNHPEGIKGAQAIAACVWMKKGGNVDDERMKCYVEEHFGYDLSVKLEDIREAYRFDVSCQGSVPIAIMAYLQRNTPLECLRLAISMGGDSDTIGCMTASIAFANNPVPPDLEELCKSLLAPELLTLAENFEDFVNKHP